MNTIALPEIKSMQTRYPATDRRLQKQEEPLLKHETFTVERQKTLESIAFLKKYVEDLRAGRPVDNLSPSNDPYYLVPENIEDMIETEEYLLQGGKFIRVNPDNIWECI